MELVCVDFLSQENVLTVTDHFSYYGQAYQTKDQKARTVAREL